MLRLREAFDQQTILLFFIPTSHSPNLLYIHHSPHHIFPPFPQNLQIFVSLWRVPVKWKTWDGASSRSRKSRTRRIFKSHFPNVDTGSLRRPTKSRSYAISISLWSCSLLPAGSAIFPAGKGNNYIYSNDLNYRLI